MPEDAPPLFDPAEDCEERTPRKILARYGFTPLAPSELNDLQLPGRLWELLYAAAARRLFFCFTDHLSDRDLYTALWEQWLDEPTADIPLEAETNTTLFVSELNANGMTHEEIWLRYYAEESAPCRWEKSFRRTKTRPTTVTAICRCVPFHWRLTPAGCPAMMIPPKKTRATNPTRSASPTWTAKSPPQKQNLPRTRLRPPRHLIPRSKLTSAPANRRTGRRPPTNSPRKISHCCRPPRSPKKPLRPFSGNSCTTCRWKVSTSCTAIISATANSTPNFGSVACATPAICRAANPRGGWFHDFLGSWGDEQMQLWLRYYATDDERAKHAQEYPRDRIPPKEKPISHRDWRLPKGPF